MKIYNEVLIDMNTGQTVYEDSYEHNGELALMQAPDIQTRGADYYTDTYFSTYTLGDEHQTAGGDFSHSRYVKRDTVNDPNVPGLKYEIYDREVSHGTFDPWSSGGHDIKIIFPDKSVKYVAAPGRVDNISNAHEMVAKLQSEISSKGLEDYGWKTAEEYDTEYKNLVDQGFSQDDARAIAAGGDKTTFKTQSEKDQEQRRIDLKREVAATKQSVTDVADTQVEMQQQRTGRVMGQALRAQNARLMSLGYSPDEAAAMTAQGSESIGRTMADISTQGALLKNKTLADLGKFGISANMTADELGLKLRELNQNTVNFQSNLANQMAMAQMQSDTARYGADLQASTQRYVADSQKTGVMDIGAALAGGIGGAVGTGVVKKFL